MGGCRVSSHLSTGDELLLRGNTLLFSTHRGTITYNSSSVYAPWGGMA